MREKINKGKVVKRAIYCRFVNGQAKILILTRMHSSRMRTGRSLTVCWSLLPGGVCSGGVSAQGVSAPGGVCSRGCLLPGGVCSRGGGVCSRINQYKLNTFAMAL